MIGMQITRIKYLILQRMPLIMKINSEKMRNIFRIFLLSVFSVSLSSCVNWIMEAPSFTLRGIALQPLSLTEMNILLDLDVQNTNSFNLTLKSFNYKVYLRDEEIGSGSLEKELLIASASTTKIQAPVGAKFKDLNTIMKVVLTDGDLPYKIEGNAEVKTILGSTRFPFTKEGRINWKN